jgi:hypothetical protein
MTDTIEISYHGKRLTYFDLKRISKAQDQGFHEPVTGFLCSVFIMGGTGVGVVFGHTRKDDLGRFEDGHFIRTSDIVKAEREGRFWVLTTPNSRYAIATFRKGFGRKSLLEFLRSAKVSIT